MKKQRTIPRIEVDAEGLSCVNVCGRRMFLISFCCLGNPQKSSGQSFFQQLLRTMDFSSSRLLYNYHALYCDASFPVFTDSNECLLCCIKGTVEDAESVMSFECGDDFLFEWLCE